MRARPMDPRTWILVSFLLPLLLAAPVAAADPSPTPLASPATTAATLFLATGDPIEDWWWLRDDAGSQYATWTLPGTPAGTPVTITFGLLATDAANGGPGVDATAWVMVGAIEDGAPGPAIIGPALMTFPNVSLADDPVGYQTLGTVTIRADEVSPYAEGLWVLVERHSPAGVVVPTHLAVNREAITVTGLAPVAVPAP